MKIAIAKTAGFCMGVRRAVELALDAANTSKDPIYSFGPLIHNPQVLSLLEEKGVSVIDRIPAKGSGTVLVRAHGVPPEIKVKLKKAGFKIIDATCPRVIKVQTIIRKHAKQGYASVIVGDKDHPEVVGLLGYAEGHGYVVDNLETLDSLPSFQKAIIVAQTTQNIHLFEDVQKWVDQKFPHYKVFDTICDSTEKRQTEVLRLAQDVDSVIVVGGKDSGNTRRLAAMAAQAGKPSFHIETESELDPQALKSFQHVGIAAGASTPNWIITKVFRTLERMPYQHPRNLRTLLFKIQRNLLLTNIYVALGAGSLCYANTRLLGIADYRPHILISILYVLSMHILNHLIGQKADMYNDPDRALFYQRYKVQLSFLATVAGASGLVTAFALGLSPFIILLCMSLLGLSYNLTFVPKRMKRIRYRRLRDIPGSKTVLIALAWGIVTSALPQLSESPIFGIKAVIVFIWATGMVFVRTAFFDILDMQGDRIIGKETIPILVGEKSAMRHLVIALAIIVTVLLGSALTQLIPALGFALIICPVFMFIVLYIHQRGHMLPGIRLEFLVESNFILAGILTFLWCMVLPMH